MSGNNTSKWIFANSDEGSYLYCEKCKTRLSAKKVIFADHPYNRCPKCNTYMEEVDDNIIEALRSSIV